MDGKSNLNLVSYANASTREIIKLLYACREDGRSSSRGDSVVYENEKRHEKRRTTSHFRYQVSRRKRNALEMAPTSRGKYYMRKAKIYRLRKNLYPRYRKQIRRYLYSSDLDHDALNRTLAIPQDDRIHRRLGTHRYTVKRMKILKQWGYCIPLKNASKACSALMDALRNHCILSDQSYHIPVYITGKGVNIIELIRNFVPEGACTFFDDEDFISGKYEANSLLYACNSFPFNLYGPTTMSFEAPANIDDGTSRLCIWFHPSYSNQILEEFEEVAADHDCTYEIRDDIARFEIRGAASLRTLHRVFKPCDIMCQDAAYYFRKLEYLCTFPEQVWGRGYILDLCVQDVRKLKYLEGGVTRTSPLGHQNAKFC